MKNNKLINNRKSTFLLIIGILIINLIIQISSQVNTSSNIEVEIQSDYKTSSPGDEIWFTVKLMNLADVGRRDVILEYLIYDSNNEKILSKSEAVAIETQASFVNSIQLPQNINEGNYILRVNLISTEKEQISGTEVSFNILKNNQNKFLLGYIITGIILLIIISLIILRGKTIISHYKIKKQIKKIIKNRKIVS